eukprot:3639155-Amphidinium_carterae.1
MQQEAQPLCAVHTGDVDDVEVASHCCCQTSAAAALERRPSESVYLEHSTLQFEGCDVGELFV